MKEVRKMYNQALIDKLLDLSRNHAGEIAELWHKGVITNPRTSSFGSLDKSALIKIGRVFLQESQGALFF